MGIDDKRTIKIALDAMGGDNAPQAVISGADIFLKKNRNVEFLIFGDEAEIEPLLQKHPKLSEKSELVHTSDIISNDEKPSQALRKGKNSSMRLSINAVKELKVDAAVSCGNTGALMAMSKLVLRTLPCIDRPAITSVFPTIKDRCVLLDLGANIDCNADNLVQFAIMGDAFAKVILNKKDPSIGILNVGSEDVKGSETVKAAANELREGDYPLNFYGYVEGNDLAAGVTDVVVTDGFTGNIALKTAEGTARICREFIKKAFLSSPLAMLGGLLAKRCLKKTFNRMDPRSHNGAMFLGLNGIVVKSHGGTDAIGFSNALNVAYELAFNDINDKINQKLSIYEEGIEE